VIAMLDGTQSGFICGGVETVSAWWRLDVDHFKAVNDTYGHDVGDRVLQELASRIRVGVRNIDLVSRMGGEEFAVVLPDARLEIALNVAERVRRIVSASLRRRSASGPASSHRLTGRSADRIARRFYRQHHEAR